MKSKIKESIKTKSCGSYPCTNTWGGGGSPGQPAYCDTGYVRTSCNASCTGLFGETDLLAVVSSGGNEGCDLGSNDKCVSSGGGSSPARIKVQAICLKFE